FAQHSAFGCYRKACPRIVERGAGFEARTVGKRFDRERTLSNGWAHDVGTERFADNVVPAETPQTGRREHNCVVLAFLHLVDACIDVAANGLYIQIRPE